VPSYSPVFSQGFIYYTDSSPNTAFQVPEGFTAVVRECDVLTTAGDTWASFNVQASDIAPVVGFALLNAVGLANSQHWEGRVVCPGGGTISIYQNTLGVGANIYVGGYLLRNTLS
jgi:hypothetical protein